MLIILYYSAYIGIEACRTCNNVHCRFRSF